MADYIGDPNALLSTRGIPTRDKIAWLEEWRSDLARRAETDGLMIGSGEAHRLIEIEQALHFLRATRS